jgi:hypothetical protein
MGKSGNKYYDLIASLPRLTKNFVSGVRIPIDRESFFDRLRLLKEKERREMEILFEHSKKIHEPMKWSDQDVIELYEETYSNLNYPFLRELILNGLKLRLVIFVFRMRKLGIKIELPECSIDEIERFITHLKKNIEEPDLKLTSVLGEVTMVGNIVPIREAIETKPILEAERVIDNYKWEMAEKLGEGEFFTFKSLISYFMKWDIIYRWSRVNTDTGLIGFEEVLGEVQRYEF